MLKTLATTVLLTLLPWFMPVPQASAADPTPNTITAREYALMDAFTLATGLPSNQDVLDIGYAACQTKKELRSSNSEFGFMMLGQLEALAFTTGSVSPVDYDSDGKYEVEDAENLVRFFSLVSGLATINLCPTESY